MSFPLVNLESVCEVISGQSPPSNTYNDNKIGLPFFQGKADFGQLYPVIRMWCSEPLKISLPNDILLSVRAPVGPTNLNNSKACIGRGLSAIRCSNRIETKFLLHFLRFNEQKIADKGTGSTFKAINQKDIKALEIPLPPLVEQQKIAAILDAADSLRQKDQQLVERYTALSQSLFLEMFGDPMLNQKKWPMETLGKLIKEGPQNGLYKPSSDYGSGTPIVRIDSFQNDFVRTTHLKRVRVSNDELEKFKIFEGDFVVNRVNSPSHLGKCGLMPAINEPMVFESNMMRIRFNKEIVNNSYMLFILSSEYMKRQILTASKDAVNQSSINQKDVNNFETPLPPITLQTKFAERIQLIEAQKQQAQRSLEISEALFNSLLQRAFTGELTAKIVA